MRRSSRDWHSIEKLYVFGEVVAVRSDGSEERRFPSIRELASRVQLARSAIGVRARRGRWMAARARFIEFHRNATWQMLADRELPRASAVTGMTSPG